MPLYEFECRFCKHVEELLQKVTDPAPETCPSCGKEKALAKKISHTSFQLKGSGWYKDLYSSSPNTQKSSTSEKSGDGSTTTSTEKKTEAKPESTSKDKL